MENQELIDRIEMRKARMAQREVERMKRRGIPIVDLERINTLEAQVIELKRQLDEMKNPQ
jgi:hypothetical protein